MGFTSLRTRSIRKGGFVTQFVVFLRGINVSGVKIKMDALKKTFVENGYPQVETLLATGNVIVGSSVEHWDLARHKSHIETVLSREFDYEAFVFIKTPEQMVEAVRFARTINCPDTFHKYCLISDDPDLGDRLKGLFEGCNKAEGEQFFATEAGLFWVVPKGDTLSSEFGNKILGKKEFKNALTSRNLNTCEKILSKL